MTRSERDTNLFLKTKTKCLKKQLFEIVEKHSVHVSIWFFLCEPRCILQIKFP